MRKFFSNESGASLVEYGLLVGLIALAAITAVTAVGTAIGNLFNEVSNRLDAVTTSL